MEANTCTMPFHVLAAMAANYWRRISLSAIAFLKRESIKVEKNKLLWQKAGLSAVSIKKQYDSAKEEYKGGKMSGATGGTSRQKSAP